MRRPSIAACLAGLCLALAAPASHGYDRPLYIAEDFLDGNPGEIYYNPPGEDAPRPYSSGGWIAPENVLAVGPRLYVLDPGYIGAPDGRVVEIDTASGATRVVTSALQDPRGIVAQGEDLLVSDRCARAVLRIDRQTGSMAPVSMGGLLSRPVGMGLHPSGELYVVDYDLARIVGVNLDTGEQRVVPVKGLKRPYGVTVLDDGRVFVIDSKRDALLEVVNGKAVPRVTIRGTEQVTHDGNVILVATGARKDPAILSYDADTGLRAWEATGPKKRQLPGMHDPEGVTVGMEPGTELAQPAPDATPRAILSPLPKHCGPLS